MTTSWVWVEVLLKYFVLGCIVSSVYATSASLETQAPTNLKIPAQVP